MGTDITKDRLPAEKVTWRADPAEFSFTSTADIPPPKRPIDLVKGQEHAKRELLSAIRLRENAILIGPAGTGKSMLAKAVAEEYIRDAKDKVQLTDQLLVYNATNPFEPEVVSLPTPMGREFQHDLRQYVRLLPKGGTYIVPDTQLDPKSYTLTFVRPGFFSTKTYSATLADLVDIAARQIGVQKMPDAMERLKNSREPLDEPVIELPAARPRALTLRDLYGNYQLATENTGKAKLDEIVQKYRAQPNVVKFFADIARSVAQNPSLFQQSMFSQDPLQDMKRQLFEANIIVDNADTKGLPVQYIENPSIPNIMGEAGHDAYNALPAHMRIKAGKLHLGNKGLVIIDELITLLQDQFMRNYMLTVLQERKARIGGGHGLIGGGTSAGIESKPVEADCIVIGCGNEDILPILQQSPKLSRRFSHKVMFEPAMPNTPENRQALAAFVAHEVAKYNKDPSRTQKIPHFAPDGVATIVELACRAAQFHVHGREHLTNVLAPIASVVHRAGLYALDDKVAFAGREQVYKAVMDSQRVGQQIKDDQLRTIEQGLRTIKADGTEDGVVNGLGVIRDNYGVISFGLPMRVMATASAGRGGIYDAEIKAGLAESIRVKRYEHVKALFDSLFSQRAMEHTSIAITNPQVYTKSDGDSDSIPVFIAVLAAVTGFKLQQCYAMTGSLSARGHVQPIGGVNEKVEGWYDACMKLGGLTGRQGVLIPVQNAGDLVLRPDVAGAIADSQFHVIPVSHRDTAVEYMFNRPAEEVYGKFKSELERYAKEARTQRKEA